MGKTIQKKIKKKKREIKNPPTLSLGINFKSLPCLRKIFPEVWLGLIPIPLLVIIALVSGVTLNCSAINLIAALNGASSGTSILYLIISFIFFFTL